MKFHKQLINLPDIFEADILTNLKVFNDSHRFYSLEKWNLNFVIAFKGYDKDKSKESIEKVLTYVNNEIDNDFKIKFQNLIDNNKNNIDIHILNIDMNIKSLKESINNEKIEFIDFLYKQHAIAKKLNIKNNIETSSFSDTSNKLNDKNLFSYKTDYYLKGYEIIEQEINSLITSNEYLYYMDDSYRLLIAHKENINNLKKIFIDNLYKYNFLNDVNKNIFLIKYNPQSYVIEFENNHFNYIIHSSNKPHQ